MYSHKTSDYSFELLIFGRFYFSLVLSFAMSKKLSKNNQQQQAIIALE